jgi:uncharacterized protein DUF6931
VSEPLIRIAAKSAAEVCKLFPLGDEAKPLLKDGLSPQQFLDVLEGKALYVDAFRFLAYGLPKREGVFWAVTCAKQVAGPQPPANVAAALAAANKWVLDPSEDNRRATEVAYQAAELSTAAGCAAIAAFWSGGSLSPKDLPVVPPAETLTAHGVASAVLIASIAQDPAKTAELHKAFATHGRAIASGKLKWT